MGNQSKASSFLVKILIGGISVLIAEFFLKGIHIDTFMTGFILAAVIILINLLIKPILVFLTFPITLITLGLFLLVINAGVIIIADRIIPGFEVDGFWWALLFSIVLSIINSLFGNSLDADEK
jgi:putative membrane protein